MSATSEKSLKLMVEELIKSVEPQTLRQLMESLMISDLSLWLRHCQEEAKQGSKHGYVHQDLVNTLGKRLGFDVTFGEYGRGPDGVWTLGQVRIVVESKTSPMWLKLEQLNESVEESKATSGLCISQSFETTHAGAIKGKNWNIRLLTTDGLCKLAELISKGVITTDHVASILVPQETYSLDGLIDLVYGISLSVARPESSTTVVSEKERIELDSVPEQVKHREDSTKALYKICARHPTDWFDPTDIAEEAKQTYPTIFRDKTASQIAYGFPFGGMFLEKLGLIEIKRDEYGRRSYRFKV